MKINLSDKIIAYLALISGLTISAVAIWYSVAGLVSIFAAAVIPIIVMGVALEISKLIATVWLKINWNRAPVFIRTYLLIAIAILMVITSMGIFGFLSKAHSDAGLVSGDVMAKIAVYDEKIKTSKDNIEANRKAIKQMDEAVDQSMARSTDEKGANRAVSIRQSQQKERVRLQTEITAEQKNIAKLNEERAPVAAEVRKVEAEVGPIKYIANFIYGDNPDANILEKAVTWVIIIIVAVFDPLAVILLLASQYSFQWFRKADEDDEYLLHKTVPAYEPDDGPLTEDQVEQIKETVADPEEKSILDNHPYLNTGKSFWAKPEGWVDVPPQVYKPEEDTLPVAEERHIEELDDTDILEEASLSEKEAMHRWKADNPENSLKLQRRLFERGSIDRLPWEQYLKPQADYNDNEAALEAAKWAQEQLEQQPTTSEVSYMENVDGHQVKKTIDGYQQNAEQGENTIWKRIKKGLE